MRYLVQQKEIHSIFPYTMENNSRQILHFEQDMIHYFCNNQLAWKHMQGLMLLMEVGVVSLSEHFDNEYLQKIQNMYSWVYYR